MTIASQLTSINDSKQAIKTAIEAKGVTVGTAAFDQYAGKIADIDTSENPWYRNPSWLTEISISSTDSIVKGVYRVDPQSSFAAFSCTVTGGYTVNWGDGSTPTNHSSGAVAYKEYNSTYGDISSDTRAPVTFTASTNIVNRTAHGYKDGMLVSFAEITTTTGIEVRNNYYVVNATDNTFQISKSLNGSVVTFTNDGSGYILPYKQVYITITPQTSNNFTALNFNVKHNQSGLQNGYATGWLDLVVSGPSLTTLTLGASGTTVVQSNLQQFQLISNNSISSFNFFFGRCYNLQSVPKFVLRTTGTCTMNNMFNFCYSLIHAPLFTDVDGADNSARVTSMDTMFRYCYALKYVPNYNCTGVTNFNTMIGDAFSLEHAPMLNMGSPTQAINMFFGSINLKTVPGYKFDTVTAAGSMFQNCNQLEYVGPLDLSAISSSANLNNWVTSCPNLKRIEAYGMRFTHSIANCMLDAAALDAYYTGLPTVTAQTLTVSGNWGVATDDPSIATAKGWTVTG